MRELLQADLIEEFSKEFDIPKAEITQAAHAAWVELLASRDDIRKKGEETLAYIKDIIFTVSYLQVVHTMLTLKSTTVFLK